MFLVAFRDQVKASWVKQILGYKEWDVYTKIRARIWLRKNGEVLTNENVELEVERIRANKGGGLSEQDVIESLECGEEVRKFAVFAVFWAFSCHFQQRIDIIIMECVDYDHAFIRDLESQALAKPTQRPPKDTPRKSTNGSDSNFEVNSAVRENGEDPNSGPSGLRRSSRVKQPSFRAFFESSDDEQSSEASDCDLARDLEEE